MLRIKQRLSKAHPALLTFYVMMAAFCSYTCMYAFRKAFPAATFEDAPELFGLSFKSVLVISQVLGYMLSKFIGIKVVSEMDGKKRAAAILILIGIAELALLGFGAVSPPYNMVFLFFNGLPLGMIWGLVFSYVEGRRQTEIIGLGLCASFIFASGFVKDIGRWVMEQGISEYWMPFVVGLIFALPLVLFVRMLDQSPEPTHLDQQERTARAPMNGSERIAFFRRFAPGLSLLVIVYTMLTAYRDFRDNFLADIWQDVRPDMAQPDFSATETPISISVLLILMLLVLVKNNRKALMINHAAILFGVLTAGFATWGYHQGWLSDYLWILLTGFGTYMAYIPFNSILFDRMIATFRYVSNVGFLIYLADSFGYMGSVGVLLYKDFGAKSLSWTEFFTGISYALAGIGLVGLVFSWVYFQRKAVGDNLPQDS